MKYLLLLLVMVSSVALADNDEHYHPMVEYTEYLPYHPTAATIYPRTVIVRQGETWNPSMGRMEYLYKKPEELSFPQNHPDVIVNNVFVGNQHCPRHEVAMTPLENNKPKTVKKKRVKPKVIAPMCKPN